MSEIATCVTAMRMADGWENSSSSLIPYFPSWATHQSRLHHPMKVFHSLFRMICGKMDLEEVAVEKFREYVRIKTVQPDPDYESAKHFLQRYADELGLDFKVVCPVEGKPVVLVTWKGEDPGLPSILLVSHVDVVPVFPECWTHEPFSADIDEEGKIFGRGTQDMKCVGIQYLEAVRRLKKDGRTVRRTLHMCFLPDEEIGGVDGMGAFIETAEFRDLNVGFAMDEGLASPDDVYSVFYGERSQQWLEFVFTGNPGHGSRFIADTAAEKFAKFLTSVMEFREEQKLILESSPDFTDGDVTSANMTILKGGVQPNVVPSELRMTVDFRVSPRMGLPDFRKRLDEWMTSAGPGVACEPVCAFDSSALTSIKDDNPFWTAFSGACSKMDMKIKPQIFPAGTDSRYLRSMGIPSIGFSPMINTPILLHDHDEYLKKDVFLRGVEIYCKILPAVAGVGA